MVGQRSLLCSLEPGCSIAGSCAPLRAGEAEGGEGLGGEVADLLRRDLVGVDDHLKAWRLAWRVAWRLRGGCMAAACSARQLSLIHI